MKNASQIDDWNGATGARWVDNQERLDRILAPYGDAALDAAAARAGEAVLDIGCGAGGTTLALAESVQPGGRVVGIDISEPLIVRARERAAAVGLPIDFRLEDASRAPLPAAAFDLLFSRFGVMFFDAPSAAFRHMRTALKPGGRLAFICWRSAAENDWAKLPIAALRGIVPIPDSDPNTPGPYAFGNRARLEGILAEAGFTDIAIQPFDAPLIYGVGASRKAALDDALDYMMQIGPVPRLLADKPEDMRAKAIAAVREALASRLGEAGVVIDGAAWVVTGRNP
ncbi:class I SAM-dependent methyltransferase [Sphingosinicella sp.]|uniref:class I SAM-dependent methyltransferase n=1 Tax=Sphingosinicella sp. TaxID=1917971 RepID=UPI0017CDBCBA|nr:class I SAM-dependent methyltransferase [Sphingosinicella sp.]MBA4759506.1 class I SAM-dependent methyltransferase [Sphingosinicella sp.]